MLIILTKHVFGKETHNWLIDVPYLSLDNYQWEIQEYCSSCCGDE